MATLRARQVGREAGIIAEIGISWSEVPAQLRWVDRMERLAMERREMVALHEILQEALPIHLPHIFNDIAESHLLHVIGRNQGVQAGKPRPQRWRIRGERDKHEPLPERARKFREPAAGAVEIVSFVDTGSADQAAESVVGPVVIGTDKVPSVPPATGQDGAAMTANV